MARTVTTIASAQQPRKQPRRIAISILSAASIHILLHSVGMGLARAGCRPPTLLAVASTPVSRGILVTSLHCSTACLQPLYLRLAAQRRALPRRFTLAPCAAVPATLQELANSPYRDGLSLAGAAAGSLVWVKVFSFARSLGWFDQLLSRKLVHITTAPVFLLTWTLFSDAPGARYLAMTVPLLNLLRLLAVGSGAVADDGFVRSMSRGGKQEELLGGPAYYCATMVVVTALFWRDSPAGLLAVSMMCGGDGLADVVGRAVGGPRLPYNAGKSWAGSSAMLLGGGSMAYSFVVLFHSLGFLGGYTPASLVPIVAAVALAATAVESLPINSWLDDNISVPVVSAVLCEALLPLAAVPAS